jgi:hypothetical protein
MQDATAALKACVAAAALEEQGWTAAYLTQVFGLIEVCVGRHGRVGTLRRRAGA